VTELALDVMGRPFAWGDCDCGTAACDVFAALHGVDPMAPIRGTYATEAEARALIASAGGWQAFVAGLCARAGLRPGTGAAGELGVTADSCVIGAAPGVWLGKGRWGMVTVRDVEASWCVG